VSPHGFAAVCPSIRANATDGRSLSHEPTHHDVRRLQFPDWADPAAQSMGRRMDRAGAHARDTYCPSMGPHRTATAHGRLLMVMFARASGTVQIFATEAPLVPVDDRHRGLHVLEGVGRSAGVPPEFANAAPASA
jgi:hypothetical protein